MKTKRFIYVGASLLALLPSQFAYAQDDSPSAEAQTEPQSEILVTATRREERVADVPMSITAVSAEATGGAIRFITPQPSLTNFSLSGRAEANVVDGGGTGYEVGAAAGTPSC